MTLVFHNSEMHYCTSTGSESFPLFWDVRHAALFRGKHCVTLVFHNSEMHYCKPTGNESFPLFWDVRHATLLRGNTM